MVQKSHCEVGPASLSNRVVTAAVELQPPRRVFALTRNEDYAPDDDFGATTF